jgi:hypothetical protein
MKIHKAKRTMVRVGMIVQSDRMELSLGKVDIILMWKRR